MKNIQDYGRFIAEEGCFELTQDPPRKWRNFHYNDVGEHEFLWEVSNIGDGQGFVRDADGNICRIISWDCTYLYLRDEDSGEVFCPWGEPAPMPVENRKCRYYAAKTEVSSDCLDLHVNHRTFVPRNLPAAIWTVNVKNRSDKPRRISLFAYTGFDLSGLTADSEYVNAINSSEVIPEMGGVLVTNRSSKARTDRYKGYIFSLNRFTAGCGYRDRFTRNDFSLNTPKIHFGWSPNNEGGFGSDCAGLVQVILDIPPGETLREDFLIGQCANADEVKDIRKNLTPEKIDEMLAEQEAIQAERQQAFTVDLGEEHTNRSSLINMFVKKNLAYYLIEGVGFRDCMQNDFAGALINPKQYTDNLLYQFNLQNTDGSYSVRYRPLRRQQYSDQPTWPMLTVPGMIDETGDLSLLEQKVPFLESNETGTVWEHMVRGMRYLTEDLGANGLCDQRYADWNDGLEAHEAAGDRESIMVTQQLCYGLTQMERMAGMIGDTTIQQEARQHYDEFKQRLNNVAWDGRWYVRTICGDGYHIGSNANKEAKIFMNTQSWAVISSIADEERAKSCMDAVEELSKHDIGYRICAPPFTEFDRRVGQVSDGIPGHIENGGCYCHGATFKMYADCLLGRPETAWETWMKLAPDSPWNPVGQSRVEPFAFTNSYTTVESAYGQAGYPWRTGTAGWMTSLLVERILGARRNFDGLLIDPCLTKTIPQASIQRTFRGATYNISLDNSAGRCIGASSIICDGQKIDGNVLPIFPDGEHNVQVII